MGSSNFLYRLGVKTILSVIGLDNEIVEVDNLDQFKAYLLDDDIDYFILSEDLLSTPVHEGLAQLASVAPTKRILLIGDEIKEVPDNFGLINGLDHQKDVLAAFQSFFIEDKGPRSKQDNILTDREIDVLRHVALGMSNKEMADKLFISTNTVITHRKNITDKLGIKTIPGLTVYAIMNNIINPDEVKY